MKVNYGLRLSKKLMLKLMQDMIFLQEMFQGNLIWEILLVLQSENMFLLILILLISLETLSQQVNLLLLFLNNKFWLWASIQTIHLLSSIVNQMVVLNWETHGVLLKKEQNFLSAKRVSSNLVPTKQKTLFLMSWLP